MLFLMIKFAQVGMDIASLWTPAKSTLSRPFMTGHFLYQLMTLTSSTSAPVRTIVVIRWVVGILPVLATFEEVCVVDAHLEALFEN